jgi:hypothetical protein
MYYFPPYAMVDPDSLTMWLSNDCCSDFPHWTQYMLFDSLPTEDAHGALTMWDLGNFWHWRNITLTPADIAFTDEMCIKFQITTNAKFVDLGWDVDYLEIIGDVSGPFVEEEFNTLDWWTCTVEAYSLWHDIGGGCWEWSDTGPQYYANLNDALVYFTDTTQAYNVDLSFDLDYVLGAGDTVYLEISNDNVTWDLLDTFEGTFAGTYTVPINAYVPGQVFIRFRATSDETGFAGYFNVCNMLLMGMLDLHAPTTDCAITGVYCDGKYTSDVTVTITGYDDVTGIAAIYYKLDGGAQQVYTGPITVSAEGAHTVEYWAVDNAGNVETPHNMCTGFTIDKDTQAPTVSITAPTAGITIFGNTIPFGKKVIIIGGFTATATASDDSGVHSVKFFMDDVLFGESTGPTYSAYCGLKHMGAGVLKAVATDNTGKTGTATLDVTYFKLL